MDVSIIQAYKSDLDGKLFESKAKYVSHLKNLAGIRLLEKSKKTMDSQRNTFLDTMGQVSSIADLEKFIKDNWKWFWRNALHRNAWRTNFSDKHEYAEVSFTSIRWLEKMGNTHSCPRGGVMCFNTLDPRNSDKPKSYPGWRGRITIKVRPQMSGHKKNPVMSDGFGSDYFSNTIIHTGTGGGGSGDGFKVYSYDVSLWAADFPVMYEKLRKEQYIIKTFGDPNKMWQILGGTGSTPLVTDVPPDWVCPSPWPDNVNQTKG